MVYVIISQPLRMLANWPVGEKQRAYDAFDLLVIILLSAAGFQKHLKHLKSDREAYNNVVRLKEHLTHRRNVYQYI